jgi:hypothetical protein
VSSPTKTMRMGAVYQGKRNERKGEGEVFIV